VRARISYVTVKRSGTRAVRDVVVDVELLRIGRGTDNQIQLAGLSVALDHAAVHVRNGRPWIETVRGDLRVDGRVVSARSLSPGDVVRIGPHELRVREPGAGEDVAVEVEQVEHVEAAAAALAARTRLGIRRGLLSPRPLAWITGVIAVAVFVLLPLWSEKRAAPFDPQRPEQTRDASARLLAAAWNSGPISASHAHFAEQCNACHTAGFEGVGDEACMACHPDVGAHSAPAAAALPDASRCVDCHREHRGGATLATFPDSLCAGCHADIGAAYPDSELLDAADFADAHPQLRPAVVMLPGTDARQRLSLDSKPREQSGLRFPHAKHLTGVLKTPAGPETLQCRSCHTPDARGQTMATIDFETHCRRCHQLSFDESAPERHAVHGRPDALRDDLFEFYATRALKGEETDAAAPEIVRRRPGRELTPTEKAGVIRWVGEKTARVERLLLADGGPCSTCHVLERSAVGVHVVPARLVPFEGA
jgi:hypothetical protein